MTKIYSLRNLLGAIAGITLLAESPEYANNLSDLLKPRRAVAQELNPVTSLEQSIAELESKIKENPEDIGIRTKLSHLYISKKDWVKAEESWQILIQKDPENYHNYISLSHVYEQKRDPDKAIATLQRALSIKPDYAAALSNMALAYLQKDELDRAFAFANLASVYEPDLPPPYDVRTQVYFKKGKLQEARKEAIVGLTKNPYSTTLIELLKKIEVILKGKKRSA